MRSFISVVLSLLFSATAWPCTNFLITKGATADGSVLVSYSADSHTLYGELYHRPAAVYPKGTMIDIYEWDTGKKLGRIPQAERTYEVVGNLNEHQVAIGETTFGGREELRNEKGAIDYGSLMYIALQRSKTAREAIQVMTSLAEQHTYSSSGESFTVADPNEIWLLEMVGPGKEGKGAHWVARRIPDGMISAHANQSRIRRFPLRDPENCVYSKDVITFARKQGWFKGTDEEFSFADAYHPLTFDGLRFCEARVYAMFRRVAPSLKLSESWIRGEEKGEPLPLWIKPDRKLTVQDTLELMRDHFEGTSLYLGNDVGAGPYNLPYRWRPLTWKVGDREYVNERSTSTQQTGFSFIAQLRAGLPGPVGGVLWFGVDDTASTVYVPMYAGIREAPYAFRVGTGNFKQFTWDSAFWVFNVVANWAYSRYQDMIKDIRVVQLELEGSFLARQADVERRALELYKRSPDEARDFLTRYSADQAERTVARFRTLAGELFVRYMDGNVRDELGNITHPGYPPEYYQRVIKETGDRYLKKPLSTEPPPKPPAPPCTCAGQH